MHPPIGLVCSLQPEGRVLSCLHTSPTQAVSPLCVRGVGISVQSLTVRAFSLSPCVFTKVAEGALQPLRERERCLRFGVLAHNSSVSSDAVHTHKSCT